MRYEIAEPEKRYNNTTFVDVTGLTRSRLTALVGELGTVIGDGGQLGLTVIPASVESKARLLARLAEIPHSPAEAATPESGNPNIEVVGGVAGRVVNDSPTTGKIVTLESGKTVVETGNIVAVAPGKTVAATVAKREKDMARRREQLLALETLLSEQPALSVSEVARQLGVSRPTARALLAEVRL